MRTAGRAAGLLACAVASSCSSAPAPATATSPATDSVTSAASKSIDPARCADSKARLRPFTINWDATEQAEFSGQTKQSIAVVKVDGCSLELLTRCKVAGEYRVTESGGNFQSLSLTSDDQLYVEVPLAVTSLSAHLERSGSLMLTYFVRGMGYATAPGLYQSQLGSGCEGATHFVINYAVGAYELSAKSETKAGAAAKGLGAGAGGATASSASALFRGGDVAKCDSDPRRCDAPVRLRLVPIETGSPPAADAAAVAIAATAPVAAAPEAPALTREEIQAGFRVTYPALKACFEASLGRSVTQGMLTTRFMIEEDGTVTNVSLTTDAAFDRTFLDCAQDVMHSLRFRPAPGRADITYPLIFKMEE